LNFLHDDGILKSLRDNVWKCLWENDNRFKEDLKNLIKSIKPKIILNGCTKELKPFVNKSINELIINENFITTIFNINHPSSWNIPRISNE
jgi:hypothetical protein